MADPSIRRDRLLSLLPRIYTAQPDGSAIGMLLTMMADRLTALDDDLTRVLRDRWVGLASGVNLEAPSALERLGGLLDRARLDGMGPTAPKEATEAYRQRLTVTARTLTRGLGTPHAILALAMADLGAEACPLMQTITPPGAQSNAGDWRVDATVAWGVRPSIRRTCPVCAKGVGPLANAVCPNQDQRVLDGWIIENPLLADSHAEPAVAFWQPFVVPSQNLAADRPVLQLTALGDVSYPALQNRATGEIALYAGILRDGETLTLWPKPLEGETQPFDSYESIEHHAWLKGHPNGQAVVTGSGSMGPGRVDRDVSANVFFISGVRFDEVEAVYAGPPPGETLQAAREIGTRFSVLDNVVRTPLLRAGGESWMLLQLANPRRSFDDSDSKFADASDLEGTRFAQWDDGSAGSDAARARVLFEALREAELAAAQAQGKGTPKPVADLVLRWFARTPATFRLGIPRTGWVEKAEAIGGVDLLRADLDLARPAGVRALLDFPQPAWRDGLAPGEDWLATLSPRVTLRWQEDATATDADPRRVVRMAEREQQPVGEGILVMLGRYDVTRFDMTALG